MMMRIFKEKLQYEDLTVIWRDDITSYALRWTHFNNPFTLQGQTRTAHERHRNQGEVRGV